MRVDDNVLVCMRAVDIAEPVKGSKPARCFLCDQSVWVGPQSLSGNRVTIPVVCMSCVTNCTVSTNERNAL